MKKSRFLIEGLGGAKRLEGTIAVKGAKNAVLKSMAAAILFKDDVTLANVPQIEDVKRMAELLRAMGAEVTRPSADTCTISPQNASVPNIDETIAKKLRASIVFTGPILARMGKVSFPHPGGDVIGSRPINLFLDGFKKMGGEVTLEGERYIITTKQGLQGAEIFFMFVSVTATETLMMAATLAQGTTILKNAAMEPEIVELANFLNECGAHISGVGTPTITIVGGSLLEAKGRVWYTVPDRIEAGTFLLLGALAAKKLTITNCNPAHVEMLIELLRESGVPIQVGENEITVVGVDNPHALQVRTHEYPGFATDLQPPMVVYLTQAVGESTVFETIWGGRLNYTQDLVHMGADITLWNPLQITIKGKTPLMGRELESPDIRAGLAFLMAASVATGNSIVENVYHIDRGYERIEERLSNTGLNIQREEL